MLQSMDENIKLDISKKTKAGTTEMSTEEMVVMKADMGISWEKLKKMIRCHILIFFGV